MARRRVSVLFVCMGNICRSPMAEGLFRHLAGARGLLDRFNIDSAGTGGWHVGDPPDGRMREVASRRGVGLSGGARQITETDLDRFEHVLCMDADNLQAVKRLGGTTPEVRLMLEHHHEAHGADVPDPYYGGREGFDHVFDLLHTACEGLLDDLVDRYDLEP